MNKSFYSINLLHYALNRRIIAIIKAFHKDTNEQRTEFLIAYEKKDVSMSIHIFVENVPQIVLQSYIVISSWITFGKNAIL